MRREGGKECEGREKYEHRDEQRNAKATNLGVKNSSFSPTNPTPSCNFTPFLSDLLTHQAMNSLCLLFDPFFFDFFFLLFFSSLLRNKTNNGSQEEKEGGDQALLLLLQYDLRR
jgi:hypothetical protein